ncbi:MAG TPA: cytochrome b/b6 domain-containing protein [Hyphomicrobiales bacterium]|nr:cytochrome b/b6 domain-containing protein [Kaistiaceae bacterium]HQF30911.1 cytochrome b/b6 domain-containing protein [Hyphomicrobiales bacterium]
MTGPVTRYSSAIVALHWITAAIILLLLTVGGSMLEDTKNVDPAKIGILRTHIILGGTAVFLTLVRMVLKRTTPLPPAASGNPLLDKAALAGHLALYLVVLLVGFSGVALALQTDLLTIVFGAGGTLPETFFEFTPRKIHGLLTKLLFALVALHVVAALYHQFVLKDGLFRRMWFGAR